MKKGWEIKALGNVCDFEGGSQPPKSQFVYEEKRGYVRFLQIRDFGSDKNITYIPQAKKNRLCNESDILIGRYGASVGKILTDKAGAYNVALMKTLPNLAVLNRSWFYNYLLSDEFQLRLLNVADRSAQAGFSKDDIYNFPVPLPPLAEQQRIVGLLDEAFEGIATAKANAEKNRQNARALFESHLQSVFSERGEGWVEKSLGETCEMYQPKTIGTKDLVLDGPYPVFGANGVIGRYDKFNHEEPQLLVTCRGATCGSVNISQTKSWITGNAMVVRPKDHQLDLHFLEFFFRGGIDISVAVTGAAQPQITRTNLSPLLICYPESVREQKRLAKQFEDLTTETHRLGILYTRKLAALEALKKSLLHQAFGGEL